MRYKIKMAPGCSRDTVRRAISWMKQVMDFRGYYAEGYAGHYSFRYAMTGRVDNIGDGYFTHVHTDADFAYRTSLATDDGCRRWHHYCLNRWQDNEELPAVYCTVECNGIFVSVMEKLISMNKAGQMFLTPEDIQNHRSEYGTDAEAIMECMFGHGDIKGYFAVTLDDAKSEVGTNNRSDTHHGNVMVRTSNGFPQLVLTDPWSGIPGACEYLRSLKDRKSYNKATRRDNHARRKEQAQLMKPRPAPAANEGARVLQHY